MDPWIVIAVLFVAVVVPVLAVALCAESECRQAKSERGTGDTGGPRDEPTRAADPIR